MSDELNRMAEISDWLEDMRQSDERRERGESTDVERAVQALQHQGVSFILAAEMAFCDGCADLPLEDAAEVAALEYLILECKVDRDDLEAVALARTQASYARKLNIRMQFLVHNLKRNLERLEKRRAVGRWRRDRRLHAALGTLTEQQRRLAESMWQRGANHGVTFCHAMGVEGRRNRTVYQRVRRVLKKVMST